MQKEPKKKLQSAKIKTRIFQALLFMIMLWPTTSLGNDGLTSAWQEIIHPHKTSVQQLEPVLNHFIQQQRQSNINNATIYSLALLEMAFEPDLKNDVKTLLTTTAITISPDYSFPETALCKLLFQQQHYLKSLLSLIRAGKKFQTNPQENYYASTFFWFAVAFTPIALLLLITLLMTVKYYRAFCEMGRIKLNRQGVFTLLAVTAATAVMIILVPTPLPGLLLLACGISLVATKRDIITLILLISTLLIVPLAYEKGMTSLLALDSSFFKAARHTTSGLYDETDKTNLRQPATNQSQQVLQLFSQSESARLRKEYAEAGMFLTKIIADKIELGAVYNNLANLYLLQNRPEKTEELYLKAGKLEKSSGIPYYNLSQTYIRQSFNLEKSSQALEQALKLDPTLNQYLTNNNELTIQGNSKLIFMALPKNFYRHYADDQPDKGTFLPEFLRYILFPGAGSALYFALTILSLGGLSYLAKITPANRRVCSLCGRLFHPDQKQKEKNCPSCRISNRLEASSLLKNATTKSGRPRDRSKTLILTAGGALLPGFYPFITDNLFIAFSLLIPTLLWLYNLLICRTGIMDPFIPSTSWLTLVLPLAIWCINLAVLALSIYRRQRRNTPRSNP
ncbi:MAG: tetratricopeptide repeat protein [Pseudomonadota bacterium]|nr:tetratricopeptide repeat protein [Pseudomonadota bacterium]